MMTNLFAIFDPSTSMSINLNWMAMLTVLLWVCAHKFSNLTRGLKIMSSLKEALTKELMVLLPNYSKMSILMMWSLFLMVISMNSMGLLPYVFTPTSHLVITLGVALPLWCGSYLYGWCTKTKTSLAHLVPVGTPSFLMPLLVVIESISALIRPITLSVRLAANMIAGHLLLTLAGGSISITATFMGMAVVLSQILLMLLETAVALIQAYVLVVLSTLYLGEI